MSAKPLIKFLIVLVWSFVLLFPMLGIDEGRFVWERLFKVLGVIAAIGVLLLLYQYFFITYKVLVKYTGLTTSVPSNLMPKSCK